MTESYNTPNSRTTFSEFLMSEHCESDFESFYFALGDAGIPFHEGAKQFADDVDSGSGNLAYDVENVADELMAVGKRLCEMSENYKVHERHEALFGKKMNAVSALVQNGRRWVQAFGSYYEESGMVYLIHEGSKLTPTQLGGLSGKEVAEMLLSEAARLNSKGRKKSIKLEEIDLTLNMGSVSLTPKQLALDSRRSAILKKHAEVVAVAAAELADLAELATLDVAVTATI